MAIQKENHSNNIGSLAILLSMSSFMCPLVQFPTNCAGLITTQRRVLNQNRKRTGSLRANSVKLLYMADGGTMGKKTPLKQL